MLDDEDWSQLSDVASLHSFPLISTPEKCRVSSDTRGDLGPVDVILRGGDDWNRDRHAVHNQRGARWYQFDWDEEVWIAGLVLDWETAHAEKYELLVRSSPDQDWEPIFKARYINSCSSPSVNMKMRCWGKSPVINAPLHHLHKINVPLTGPIKSLQVFVHDKKCGYLSLWQMQVYGYERNSIPAIFLTIPTLLTEDPSFVTVTASDAGEPNLGVANILRAGTSFAQDRWFVRPSDICGGLWVVLQFAQDVIITKVVLDWTGQHANTYDLQVGSPDNWRTIRSSPDTDNIQTERTGKLPLVTDSVCLHHVDTIEMPVTNQPTRFLRLFIYNPATDLGLSLWQARAYGFKLP
jgi:hypothetical protein